MNCVPRPFGNCALEAGRSRALPLKGALLLWLFAAISCGTSTNGDAQAKGGNTATGGQSTPSQGGSAPSGGTGSGGASGAANGGQIGRGGDTQGTAGSSGAASGGASSSGGAASGGNLARGGSSAQGGASAGATAQGGVSPSGGVTARGGGTAQGGTAAANGGGNNQGGSAAFSPCPATGMCKVMPFGDSITDGYMTPGGYRIELFRLAHQAGKSLTFVGSGSNGPGQVDGVTFPPNHEGHSGYTINDETSAGRMGISPLVSSRMKTYTPNIVLLMIGTNDVDVNIDLANAPTRLAALIDSIFSENPNVMLVLAQITPTRDDAENGRVQTYNAAIPAIVRARADAGRHISLVDMYGAVVANTNYKTALLADSLHPNSAGYAVLGQTFYAAIASALR